jgi:hypothetical protein
MTTTTEPPPVPISPPTPLECLRYRYHHGCNLGSVYVVEKWLTSSAFPPDATNSQTSELAAVTLAVNKFGLDAARTKFEARWKSSVTDADWDWLCNKAKCKIRVYPPMMVSELNEHQYVIAHLPSIKTWMGSTG